MEIEKLCKRVRESGIERVIGNERKGKVPATNLLN